MIKQQKLDAYNQKMKIEHERKIAKAKATELSIAAAKARAHVELSYKHMVVSNNKICQQCSLGKVAVMRRRKEMDEENR